MSRKRKRGRGAREEKKSMQTIYSATALHGCKIHPAIDLKCGGRITGGKNAAQASESDMWIMLDEYPIEDAVTCIDSTGKFSLSEHKRVILFPIVDRGIPKDIVMFNKLLEEMDMYIKDKKHVHISCIGGHGRTGMMIASYLGKYYKIPDPVNYVREIYCTKAVESYKQHALVHEISGIEVPKEELYVSVMQEDPWAGYTFHGYGGRNRFQGYGEEQNNSDRFVGTTMESYDAWFLNKYGRAAT